MSDMAVEITRRDPVGMITLRCDLAGPALADALSQTSGAPVPAMRRIVAGDRGAVAWMSPDELLLLLPPEGVAAACADLRASLGATHHLVVDVSDAHAVFRLSGPGARDVLAAGAPVDLAPAVFGPGDFRRTRLGQVAAAIWTPKADVFELMCFRSVAGFVADWLTAAAKPS